MSRIVRGVAFVALALSLAGCQSPNTPPKLAADLAVQDTNWAASYQHNYRHEPMQPRWDTSMERKSAEAPRREVRHASIKQYVARIAPPGMALDKLSRNIGKRRQAQIHCLPSKLKMLLNAVGWHYNKHVHIQSGYRSAAHNRRIGGARSSYHIRCEAVDIQVSGVGKYELAKFLKGLPGRGGVGTYCGKSTVHIDVGPKRAWHYGCRKKRGKRYARAKRRR